MKILVMVATVLLFIGCTSHPEQPGHIKEVTLEDGRVVEMYVFGYSIEDFLCEFERGEECYDGITRKH